jgi:hypothetical protein
MFLSEKKSNCRKCLIHCHQSPMKEQVKVVMRYSGPGMLVHHPGLVMHHVVDGFRKPKKVIKKQ